MQDKYVGDVGDFGKYGLLRSLCMGSASSAQIKLGVLWYLANSKIDRNARGKDGKHISYLSKQGYEECDPPLFRTLDRIARDSDLFQLSDVKGIHRRYVGKFGAGIRAIETVLPSGTKCFGEEIPPSAGDARSQWFERAYMQLEKRDIVFLDPDNGIFLGGNGAPAKAGKYVLPGEIETLWKHGCSLVIYHHLGRKDSHDNQIKHISGELSKLTEGASIWGLRYRRGSSRAFFILAQEKHHEVIQKGIASMEEGYWQKNNHFEVTCRPLFSKYVNISRREKDFA